MRRGLAQVEEDEAPPDAEADGVEAMVGCAKLADARHPRRLPQPPVPAVYPAAGQTLTLSLTKTRFTHFPSPSSGACQPLT